MLPQKPASPTTSTNRQKFIKLDLLQGGSTKPKIVYSSRSNSIQPSLKNSISSPLKNNLNDSSQSQRMKSNNKTINVLSVDTGLLDSIRKIKQHKLQPNINIIKLHAQNMVETNTRENRHQLVNILQQLHPFFSKIQLHIAQSIILLGKPITYYKGQLIFDTLQQQQHYQLIPTKNRTKQDLGFIIYGKVQLSNQKLFYSHHLTNGGTLFENKFINRPDKIKYYAQVCQPTLVIWLSRESYYVIRKECFLSLDLKYKFGEFENLLKYNMVNKKLPQQGEL